MNGNIFDANGNSPTLTTNKGEGNKIMIVIGRINSSQDGQVLDTSGISQCHSAGHGNTPKVAIPVSSPDRSVKNQNGRRMKDNGEPSFTLTSEDRHGCAVEVEAENEGHKPMYVQFENGVTAYAVWYEKYQCYITIRKLTPKECFRLQGWDDEYFEKAEFVNSDSQLYKQAGNGVTVNVAYAIGKKLADIGLEELEEEDK